VLVNPAHHRGIDIRHVRPEVLVAADRPAVHRLDVGRIGDRVGDQVPLPGDDARVLLRELHPRLVLHDLGGIAAAYIGHRQLDRRGGGKIALRLLAVAQPDPVDSQEGRQPAQIVVIDLAAARPLVHGRPRHAQHGRHCL